MNARQSICNTELTHTMASVRDRLGKICNTYFHSMLHNRRHGFSEMSNLLDKLGQTIFDKYTPEHNLKMTLKAKTSIC